nr:MAG TPA: hypothetical protein [Caudoviricetes sp.]
MIRTAFSAVRHGPFTALDANSFSVRAGCRG